MPDSDRNMKQENDQDHSLSFVKGPSFHRFVEVGTGISSFGLYSRKERQAGSMNATHQTGYVLTMIEKTTKRCTAVRHAGAQETGNKIYAGRQSSRDPLYMTGREEPSGLRGL